MTNEIETATAIKKATIKSTGNPRKHDYSGVLTVNLDNDAVLTWEFTDADSLSSQMRAAEAVFEENNLDYSELPVDVEPKDFLGKMMQHEIRQVLVAAMGESLPEQDDS